MHLHNLIGFLIHRTDLRLNKYFSNRLKEFNVTPEQWGIISLLSQDRGLTQKEIASVIEKDQTTVVRMIYSLEKKGFIYKQVNHNDKRSHNLLLTEEGKVLKEQLIPLVARANEEVTSRLTCEELEELKQLLNKVYLFASE